MESAGEPLLFGGSVLSGSPKTQPWEEAEADVDERTEPDLPSPRKRSGSVSSEESEAEAPTVISRKVSFADAFGFDLVSVKEFDSWNAERPSSNSPSDDAGAEDSEYCLSCLFTVPFTSEELMRKLQEQRVELECMELLPRTTSLRGTIRVSNLCFDKQVYVRTTLDSWATHFDLLAEFIPGSSDGETDRFSFKLTLMPPSAGNRVRVEFCLRYETVLGTFWANNGGMNYVLFCDKRAARDVKERPQEENSHRNKKSCLKVNRDSPAEHHLAEIPVEISDAIKSKNDGTSAISQSKEQGQLSVGSDWHRTRRSRRRMTGLARLQDHFSQREAEPTHLVPSVVSVSASECALSSTPRLCESGEHPLAPLLSDTPNLKEWQTSASPSDPWESFLSAENTVCATALEIAVSPCPSWDLPPSCSQAVNKQSDFSNNPPIPPVTIEGWCPRGLDWPPLGGNHESEVCGVNAKGSDSSTDARLPGHNPHVESGSHESPSFQEELLMKDTYVQRNRGDAGTIWGSSSKTQPDTTDLLLGHLKEIIKGPIPVGTPVTPVAGFQCPSVNAGFLVGAETAGRENEEPSDKMQNTEAEIKLVELVDHSAEKRPDKMVNHLAKITVDKPVGHSVNISVAEPFDHLAEISAGKSVDHLVNISPGEPVNYSAEITVGKPDDHSVEITASELVDHRVEISPGEPADHPGKSTVGELVDHSSEVTAAELVDYSSAINAGELVIHSAEITADELVNDSAEITTSLLVCHSIKIAASELVDHSAEISKSELVDYSFEVTAAGLVSNSAEITAGELVSHSVEIVASELVDHSAEITASELVIHSPEITAGELVSHSTDITARDHSAEISTEEAIKEVTEFSPGNLCAHIAELTSNQSVGHSVKVNHGQLIDRTAQCYGGHSEKYNAVIINKSTTSRRAKLNLLNSNRVEGILQEYNVEGTLCPTANGEIYSRNSVSQMDTVATTQKVSIQDEEAKFCRVEGVEDGSQANDFDERQQENIYKLQGIGIEIETLRGLENVLIGEEREEGPRRGESPHQANARREKVGIAYSEARLFSDKSCGLFKAGVEDSNDMGQVSHGEQGVSVEGRELGSNFMSFPMNTEFRVKDLQMSGEHRLPAAVSKGHPIRGSTGGQVFCVSADDDSKDSEGLGVSFNQPLKVPRDPIPVKMTPDWRDEAPNMLHLQRLISLDHISRMILYVLLLVILCVAAYQYGFLACFALYLCSVCLLFNIGEIQHLQERVRINQMGNKEYRL